MPPLKRALVLTTALLLGAIGAQAQRPAAGTIDPTWLGVDAATQSVEFKVVAGLTGLNGGMNFNGFARGGLNLTVPQGWSVVLRFKNQDENLPHSVEIIPATDPLPSGPVPPAFERATTGKLEQGFSTGQSADVRFVAGKAGSFIIFCAVTGHGVAGMWIRLTISADVDKPALATAPEH